MLELELVTPALFFMTLAVANALEPPDTVREGPCSGIQPRPIKANREFIDSLKYISGGSRYNLYNMALSLPNYSSLPEAELYYDACFTRNTTTTVASSDGALFGFGRTMFAYRTIVRSGIYLEAIPPSQSWNTLVDTVTLTDNKSFAVITNCWSGVDQRGWALVTLNGKLDSVSQRIIEEHLEELGFKRDNFMFMRHDSCRLGLGNPQLEHDQRGQSII